MHQRASTYAHTSGWDVELRAAAGAAAALSKLDRTAQAAADQGAANFFSRYMIPATKFFAVNLRDMLRPSLLRLHAGTAASSAGSSSAGTRGVSGAHPPTREHEAALRPSAEVSRDAMQRKLARAAGLGRAKRCQKALLPAAADLIMGLICGLPQR